MQIEITGRHIDTGQALRTHVEEHLQARVEKYFGRGGEARVAFKHHGSGYECDITVQLASGMVLRAEGKAADIYPAFDNALDKMEKRVRRYKRRLKDHHAEQKPDIPALAANTYVLKPELAEADVAEEPDDEVGDAPVVIAETQADLPPLTVGQAVMRLELSGEAALVFVNAGHGGVNVVHKRSDGAIGWIDLPVSKDDEAIH